MDEFIVSAPYIQCSQTQSFCEYGIYYLVQCAQVSYHIYLNLSSNIVSVGLPYAKVVLAAFLSLFLTSINSCTHHKQIITFTSTSYRARWMFAYNWPVILKKRQRFVRVFKSAYVRKQLWIQLNKNCRKKDWNFFFNRTQTCSLSEHVRTKAKNTTLPTELIIFAYMQTIVHELILMSSISWCALIMMDVFWACFGWTFHHFS